MGDRSDELVQEAQEILRLIGNDGVEQSRFNIKSDEIDDVFRLSLRDTTLAVYNEFGGPPGIAQLLRGVFEKAPPGSAAQTSVLGMILKGLERYGEEDGDDDEISIEALEKDLQQHFLEDLLGKLTEQTKAALLKEIA